MTEELSTAREEIQRATDTADGRVRDHLQSIDEGLMELTTSDKTQPAPVHADRLEEIEEKIVGLMDETEGATRDHLEEARDVIDAFRRENAQDW